MKEKLRISDDQKLANRKGKQQRNLFSRKNFLIRFISLWLIFITLSIIVYQGSQPITYPLAVNDISSYDIEAPRTIVNEKETELLAQEAMAAVPGKMIKNEEITAVSLANIESFIELVETRRNRLYYDENSTEESTNITTETTTENEENPSRINDNRQNDNRLDPTEDDIATAATSMVSQINQSYNLDFEISYATNLLSIEDNRFEYFKENLRTSSGLIMEKALDAEQLQSEISRTMESLQRSQNYFTSDNEIILFLLQDLLKPNVEYDEIATQNAREEAANQIRNNPIMINQGTRIVSQGDMITEDVFAILETLNLTDENQFDWQKFLGIALLNLVIIVIVLLFFRNFENKIANDSESLWALIIALFIPLIVSFNTAKSFPLSPPIYFATIIICAYFDFRTSLVLSSALAIAVYPMTSFNSYYLPVVLMGCLVAACFSRRISREDNYVKLIIATTISTVAVMIALSVIREVSLATSLVNILSVSISSMISVIVAIGVMPLFELIFNTVSPVKIIELSQPGQPLMKRLFTEAPGSSQHSMMVANLADAGCEAIGADTNLVRVGAYYHDIGKLENPLMFTENQSGTNPHDLLTPEESCRILTAHTENGVKLGKKHRLPEPVLKMIHEHHGTTVLQYFYHKACQIAEQEGREKPSQELYRYHNPLPSFRESAVLMLADSVEAAMKSAEIDNLEDAEKFMRNIIKIKVDQNQLINSGLSFHDIEVILDAFLQVYAGQFHSRIKYPEPTESDDRKKG